MRRHVGGKRLLKGIIGVKGLQEEEVELDYIHSPPNALGCIGSAKGQSPEGKKNSWR